MSNGHEDAGHSIDLAPGDEHVEGGGVALRVLGYLTGLGLAILLTATSFFVAGTDLVWQPSIPVALVVLAIAQIGVHVVFYLHITTGPDNTNNVLALAFGAFTWPHQLVRIMLLEQLYRAVTILGGHPYHRT